MNICSVKNIDKTYMYVLSLVKNKLNFKKNFPSSLFFFSFYSILGSSLGQQERPILPF